MSKLNFNSSNLNGLDACDTIVVSGPKGNVTEKRRMTPNQVKANIAGAVYRKYAEKENIRIEYCRCNYGYLPQKIVYSNGYAELFHYKAKKGRD